MPELLSLSTATVKLNELRASFAAFAATNPEPELLDLLTKAMDLMESYALIEYPEFNEE